MLTSEEYENGTDVLVTIRAKVGGTAQGPLGPLLDLRTDDGSLITRVWPDSPGVTVERLAPPEPEIPEWWERRGSGTYVATGKFGPWMRCPDDDTDYCWIDPMGNRRSDEHMLADRSLTLLHDPHASPVAPAEPLHTWPPTEPGQWFEDRKGEQCVSVRGEVALFVRFPYSAQPNGRYPLGQTENGRGPMKPIPAPDGASC